MLFSLSGRTYRGFNLSNTVSDVTVENNLSRVVTAVSHAFTSSTSRALTVSFQTHITPFLFSLLYQKFLVGVCFLYFHGNIPFLCLVSLQFGCCEALCLLALNFPVCTWSTGWHCGYISSSSSFSSRSSLSRSRGRALRFVPPLSHEFILYLYTCNRLAA